MLNSDFHAIDTSDSPHRQQYLLTRLYKVRWIHTGAVARTHLPLQPALREQEPNSPSLPQHRVAAARHVFARAHPRLHRLHRQTDRNEAWAIRFTRAYGRLRLSAAQPLVQLLRAPPQRKSWENRTADRSRPTKRGTRRRTQCSKNQTGPRTVRIETGLGEGR